MSQTKKSRFWHQFMVIFSIAIAVSVLTAFVTANLMQTDNNFSSEFSEFSEDFKKYLQNQSIDKTFKKSYTVGNHHDIEYNIRYGELTVENIDDCWSVQGSSMNPTHFNGNTLCGYEYEGEHELTQGDIVKYKNGDGSIIHRVIAEYDGYVITKGDNNRGDDGRVNKTQVTHVITTVLYT